MARKSNLQKEALSPTTSPERLRELANNKKTDRSILKAIASNPNTPKDTLLNLGKDYTLDFLKNPVLDILLLENPNLITEMSCYMVMNLLRYDSTFKFWTIETVVKHPDWVKILEKIKLSAQLLKTFAYNPDYKVRSLAAKNSNTPADVLIMLAKDTEPFVRKFVASNPKIPQFIIDILSKDDNKSVCQGVAANPSAPLHLLKTYLIGDEYFRALVASNLNTPLYMLEILAQDIIFDVRAAVAKNKSAPTSILTVLFQNCEDIFKCFLSENNHLLLVDKLQELNFQCLSPQSIQDLWDKYFDFRLAFASHSNTPPDILSILAADEPYPYSYFDAVKIRSSVAKNPNTGAEVLRILSQDTSAFVRSDVACNKNTPSDILEALSLDVTFVRMGVALNSSTPQHVLETLSQDKDVSNFVPKSRKV